MLSLEVDRLQAALTRRFLQPALPALEAFFLSVRAETDKLLAPNARETYGKPYPYGFCLEITLDVLERLKSSNQWPDCSGARALKAFLANGGVIRRIWGVLRDSFFQNALLVGGLYVDVSNDTVDVRKPKVEILPIKASGLELVRDGAHFARISERYWGVTCYANTAVPALAPAFPILTVWPDGRVNLQSKSSYMMPLVSERGFRLAKQWLREAPLPPEPAIQALRAATPLEIRDADPGVGREAALAACERYLRAGIAIDQAWRNRMLVLLRQVSPARISMDSPPLSRGDTGEVVAMNPRSETREEVAWSF